MSQDPLSIVDNSFKQPSKKKQPFNLDEAVSRHATRTGLDPELLRNIVGQESGGNPNAVSHKQARGLMQLMPGTAKRYGVRDMNDPEESLRGGSDYLKFLHDKYKGDIDHVLAAYNAGEGAVDKYGINHVRKFSNLPKGDKRRNTKNDFSTTGHYVDKIKSQVSKKDPLAEVDKSFQSDPLAEVDQSFNHASTPAQETVIEAAAPPQPTTSSQNKTQPVLSPRRVLPQPTNLTTNDLSWHLGMDSDEFKSLSAKQQQRAIGVITKAVAGDQRKKSEGQTLAPSLDYINANRSKLGFRPKSVIEQKGLPKQQPDDNPLDVMAMMKRGRESASEIERLDEAEVKNKAKDKGIKESEIRRQVVADLSRTETYRDKHGIRQRMSTPDPNKVESETNKRIRDQVEESERRARVAKTTWAEYLGQYPKSIVTGAAGAGGSTLKGLSVVSKAIVDRVVDTKGLEASDTYLYRLGDYVTNKSAELVKSNPDLAQEFFVGKAPAAVGQSLEFLLGGAVSKSPRVVMSILTGTMTAGDAYEEVKRRGGSENDALLAGIVAGGLVTPSATIGMRGAIDALEGTARAATWKAAIKKAIITGSKDSLENAPQELYEELAQGFATGNQRTPGELAEAAALGAVSPLQSTSPISLVQSRPSRNRSVDTDTNVATTPVSADPVIPEVPVSTITKPRVVKASAPVQEADDLKPQNPIDRINREYEDYRVARDRSRLEQENTESMFDEGRAFHEDGAIIRYNRYVGELESRRQKRLEERAASGDELAQHDLERRALEDNVTDLTERDIDAGISGVPVRTIDKPRLVKKSNSAAALDLVDKAFNAPDRRVATPEERALVGSITKVNQEKRKAERRAEQAELDEATGLQSPSQWKKSSGRIDADPDREVAYFDANNLKAINDKQGHAAGDRYLAHIGKVVKEEASKLGISVRQVFRAGGDEFAVDAPKGEGRRLVDAIKKRVGEYEDNGIRGGIAGGVGETSVAADRAMYANKSAMKNVSASVEGHVSLAAKRTATAKASSPVTLSTEEIIKNIKRLNTGQPDEAATRMLLANKNYEMREIPIKDVKGVFGKATEDRVATFSKQSAASQPPIVIDAKGKVIDGKHRLAAAKRRGDKTIKVWAPVKEESAILKPRRKVVKTDDRPKPAPVETPSSKQAGSSKEVAAGKSTGVSKAAVKGTEKSNSKTTDVTTPVKTKSKPEPVERTVAEIKSEITRLRSEGDSDAIIGNKLGIPASSIDALLPRDQMGQIAKMVEKAKAREKKREELKKQGIKYLGSGGPDTQVFLDRLLIKGYELYQQGKVKYGEWSKKMKEAHPEASRSALSDLWKLLEAGGKPGSNSSSSPQTTTTSIKNAVTESERVGRGEQPVEVLAQRTFGAAFDAGKKLVDSGEINIRALAESWAQRGRALQPEESTALLYDRMRLQNEHRANQEQLEKAIASDNKERVHELEVQREAIESAIETNDAAARRTGYEQGLGLAIRKAMIQEDYTLAAVIQRAKNASGNGKVSDKVRKKLESLTKQYEELQAKFESRELENSNGAAEIKKEGSRTTRKSTRQVLDAEFASLKDEAKALFKANIKNTLNTPGAFGANIDPEGNLTKLVIKMAVNRAKVGINSAAQWVDDIHTALREAGLDVERRDVAEAISGYGQVKSPNTDPMATQIREAKRQLRLVLAIEDAQQGKRPAKSGFAHEPDSAEVARLREELHKSLKASGLLTSEDKTNDRLQERIDKLNAQLDDIEAIRKKARGERQPKVEPVLSAQGAQLKAKVDELTRRLSEAVKLERKNWPKQGPKDHLPVAKRRIQERIKRLKVELGDAQSILNRAIGVKKTRESLPLDAEAQALETKAQDLRKQLSDAVKEQRKLNPVQGPKDWLPAVKRRLQKQITELEAKLADKPGLERKAAGEKTVREKKVLDAEGEALQERADRLRSAINSEIRSLRPGRVWRDISTARKAWMLMSPKTSLRNVAGNSANQIFSELSRLPSGVMDAAVSVVTGKRSMSGISIGDSLQALAQAATVGGKEAAHTMRHGATSEQLKQMQFPEEINSGSKLVDYPVKFVFRFMSAQDRLFYQAGYKRNLLDRARVQARNEVRAGETTLSISERTKALVNDPPTELDEGARHDALVMTFNNNNKLSDAISRARSALTPFQSAALDIVLPFDRTPTNIVARVVEASPAGGIKLARQVARAVVNKGMTVEEQRQFSQTFGRATTGSLLILLGWKLGAAGLLTPADDKEHPMALKVGKVLPLNDGFIEVGRLSPVGNLLVLGASLQAESRKPKKKRSYAKQVLSIPFEQPLLRGTTDLGEVIRNPQTGAGKYIANQAFSFVPGSALLRDIANLTDKKDRKASTELSFRGIKEQFQRNVPILRKRLPTKAKK
jgi:GGDEF domain-containing protein